VSNKKKKIIIIIISSPNNKNWLFFPQRIFFWGKKKEKRVFPPLSFSELIILFPAVKIFFWLVNVPPVLPSKHKRVNTLEL
jgi:hypothetical protein